MAGDSLKTDGSAKSPFTKIFSCPSCGAGITVRAVGLSITAVCGSCGSVIDTTNENYSILSKASQKGHRTQVIPLGQRGKLHGVLWEVIGYMERSNAGDIYFWSEYLLYNPYKGFVWLTEFDGHWNYVRVSKIKPDMKSEYSAIGNQRTFASYLGKKYYLFHQGTAKVAYVVGEFYWQVRQGELVYVQDFINPPEILSSQKDKQELIWSVGTHLEADDVKKAFRITEKMPRPIGVAPNQLSTITQQKNEIGKLWWIFVAILCGLQFFSIMFSKGEVVYAGKLSFDASDSSLQRVTPQFELKGRTTNLEVSVSSAINNSWFEVQSELVNDTHGNVVEFTQGVEYYSGTDYDGSWSEGSRLSTVVLSSIPSGAYHLNLDFEGPAMPVITPVEAVVVGTPPNAIPRYEYWPNGSVKSEEPYLDGKKEGIASYYHENGQLYGKIPWKNGEKHGSYKLYREDGSLDQELNYKNDKLHGKAKWYDHSNKLLQTYEYSDGRFEKARPNQYNQPVEVDVQIRRDIVTWSNFLWALALLTLYPMWVYWRSRSFEVERWSQSDFSPYFSHQEFE